MQQRQKCCAHCPGTWTSGTRPQNHNCCLPTYVRGNLKLSSLRKTTSGDIERSERLCPKVGTRTNKIYENERPSSCYDRFAIAKKFHAENLQHQPLADRVDDSIFKNPRQENVRAKRFASANNRASRYSKKMMTEYGVPLGCKNPTTNMDLAICWEAPLDPIYEPSRAIHIDGTDGGPAPAIFTLVEREIPQLENPESGKIVNNKALEIYEAKFSRVKNRRPHCEDDIEISRLSIKQQNGGCAEHQSGGRAQHQNGGCAEHQNGSRAQNQNGVYAENQNGGNGEEENGECCLEKDLCDEIDSLNISISQKKGLRREKEQPLHLRNCTSCECRGERAARKSRLTQSASISRSRNGLPGKKNVPRPRTPYAKRSFCIDTLTPPFSIVDGCRDADYPEHWRLMSIYQQSYRNPEFSLDRRFPKNRLFSRFSRAIF